VFIAWISRWRWAADNAEHPGEPGGSLNWRGIVVTVIGVALLVSTGFAGVAYVRGFVADTSRETSRLAAAGDVEMFRQAGGRRLLIQAEPAPYGVPPVNLFDWPVMLLPKGSRPEQFAQRGDVIVEVQEGKTTISWADKSFSARIVR